MWRLSDDTLRIAQQLYELGRSNSWLGRSRREATIRALLNQLAAANEPGALPCAASFLLASGDDLRETARTTVSRLMASLRPYDLIHLCDFFAGSYNWYVADEWDRLTPSDVHRVAGSPAEHGVVDVLGLLSFHPNGFVRHEAVRQLSQRWGGSELPFLLIRQNDWVKQIASDAQLATAERINEAYLEHLTRSLRLILHLSTFHRRDHHDVVHRVMDLLLRKEHQDLLTTVIATFEKGVRRRLFDYGLKMPGDHQARLVAVGINLDDPRIRLACCQHASLAYERDQLQSKLVKMSADAFMPVRRAAFTGLAERFPEVAAKTWKRALVDVSRSVRELARYSLLKLGHSESDFNSIYRGHLSDEPTCLPALEGLSETAEIQDLSYFQELLNHSLPSRRVVAIRGLLRLQKESVFGDLIPLLRDSSPRVVREVRKALTLYTHAIPGNVLLDVALHADGKFARQNAVRMLADLGKWRSVPWLLAVAAEADDATAPAAEDELIQWFTPPRCNKVFTRPSPQEDQQIGAAMAKFKGRVPDRLLEAISGGLLPFR